MADYEPRIAKFGEVMTHRGLPDVERRGEIADAYRRGRGFEDVQHLHASGIANGAMQIRQLFSKRIRKCGRDRVAAALDPWRELWPPFRDCYGHEVEFTSTNFDGYMLRLRIDIHR